MDNSPTALLKAIRKATGDTKWDAAVKLALIEQELDPVRQLGMRVEILTQLMKMTRAAPARVDNDGNVAPVLEVRIAAGYGGAAPGSIPSRTPLRLAGRGSGEGESDG